MKVEIHNMEELKYKKVDKIKVDSNLLKSVNFKPKTAPIVCSVVGIAAMFINNWPARLLGFFFAFMAAGVYFLVEEKKTIDLYEDGCVIYNTKDQSLAYYLKYDDIAEWDIKKESGHDSVVFTLLDKKRAVVDTFQTNKIYRILEQVMPEKSYVKVQAERNKKANINPIDGLRNLINRKK